MKNPETGKTKTENTELDREIFTPIRSGWKMYGAKLRRLRIWLDVTQIYFALIAGWTQQHQNKLENNHVTIVSDSKRNEIEETFRRIFSQMSNKKSYRKLRIGHTWPSELCSFCFEINYRYEINGPAVREIINSMSYFRAFAIYTGWSEQYLNILLSSTARHAKPKTIAESTAFRLQRALSAIKVLKKKIEKS